MSKLRLFFIIILLPLGFFQCSDEHPVPDVYVNVVVDLSLPQYQDLLVPTNSIYIRNEGYNGIIVTNVSGSSFSGENYAAYEATCTYDPEVSGTVVDIPEGSGATIVKIDGLSVTCDVCGSEYSLVLDGAVVSEGPAGISLKKYTARFNPNQNLLIITN